MIKPHQFIGLAGATALSVLVALGLYAGSNRWSTGKVEGAAFLPELAQNLASVAAVEVSQSGQKLTFERAGNAWKVRDRAGYPAKTETVRTLLVTLAEAQLIESRTAVKGKLPLLELEDPAAKDAKSRGVRVLDSAGKPIVSVVLGKSRMDAFGQGRGGIYVRRQDEAQSWLATGDARVTADIKDWVDTQVLTVDTGKVARLTLEHPGEEPLVVEKTPPEPKAEPGKDGKPANATPIPPPPSAAKDGKFRLANMPEGKKLKKDANVDQIIDGLASISLEDVRKLDAVPSGDKVSVLKLEQEGGPTVTLRLRKDGENAWLSLEAVGADGDAKKKADELNAKAKGWEYRIQTWKADQINKRRADLFETS
ncbi:MAG: DUF4340 domain-containing protein [Hyphomicrobiaceae bacterium]|nr:DUF4340 domain-containing protein [Hyphomicrobiaceae bacterium]